MFFPLAVYYFASILPLIYGVPFEEFEVAWKKLLAKQAGSRSEFSKDLDDYSYQSPVQSSDSYVQSTQYSKAYSSSSTSYSNSTYLSLIPGSGIIESEVSCGNDNKNFCNYPETPFVETLNIPSILASPNRLNRLASGRCPIGYTKEPTFDCLNIAAAFVETTCCVYESQPVTLTNYCSNRTGILFTATFELCDGRNFIISGSNAWQVDVNFKILGGPYSLNILTGGTVSSNVDSALVDSSCNVGFFQGTHLHWMNFPDRSPNTDQTLLQLLGAIPTNLCNGSICTATAVNFAVCPNNGFCMLSVNLTTSTGQVYEQLFLLAPGFNSFVSATQTPPGIPVTNNADLANTFKNYIAATFIRTTSQLAFIDRSNNVYFYDSTGKFISGPTNLFDLFGICSSVANATSNKVPLTLYIPYPVFGFNPNSTNYYASAGNYNTQPAIVYSSQPASYSSPASVPSNQVYQPSVPQNYGQPYSQPASPAQYKIEPTYQPPIVQYQALTPSYNSLPAPAPASTYQDAASVVYQPATAAPVSYQYQPTPVQPYSTPAPAQSYPAPAQSYPAPAQSYPAPAQSYPAPAPVLQYLPAVSPTYSAPAVVQQYAAPAPVQQYNTPAQSYTDPASPQQSNVPAPVQQYSVPSTYRLAAPAYQNLATIYATTTPVPTTPPTYYRPQVPEYVPPQQPLVSYVAPYSAPYNPPTPSQSAVDMTSVVAATKQAKVPKSAAVIHSDANQNTIFKPSFSRPSSEFFDLSAFVRNGDFHDESVVTLV